MTTLKAAVISITLAASGHAAEFTYQDHLAQKVQLGAAIDAFSAADMKGKGAGTFALFKKFRGNPVAKFYLGLAYHKGLGVKRNVLKAGRTYAEAFPEVAGWAEAGDELAQYTLGWMYLGSYGVKGDDRLAFKYFSRAAAQGHLWSQFWAALCYRKGVGVRQDYAESFELYAKAAERGHPWAQNDLGWQYLNGLGVERDEAKAREWFAKARRQGVRGGESNSGPLKPADEREAVEEVVNLTTNAMQEMSEKMKRKVAAMEEEKKKGAPRPAR